MTPVRPDAPAPRPVPGVADDVPARSFSARLTPRRLHRWLGWWARRPALGAATIYALLSMAFVGPALLPDRTLSNSDMLWSMPPWTASPPDGVRYGGANFELADATAVFHPFFTFARAAMPDVPLWNAHIMGGRPFLANAQSALFSPFTLPVYVLGLWKALTVIAILKLWTAAFGTFLLGRALGMRFGGALLAGIVFAFGTFFVVWLAWPLTNVFSLIPWLLLLTELVVRRPGVLPAAGVAALVALAFFGGHPETTFHVVTVTAVFFTFRAVVAWHRAGRRRSALTRPTAAFTLALAGGAMISAALLVPLLELLVNSADYARRASLEPGHSQARYLGALFLPDYWGRPTQTPLVPDIVSNRGWYAGAITLMLAAAAIVVRPTATRAAVTVFGVLTTAVVVGVDPLFPAVTALPGFSTAHNGRMVIFVLLTLALLAGWGLDDLTQAVARVRWRRRIALGAAVAIFCVPVVWMMLNGTLVPKKASDALSVAWGFGAPPHPPVGQAPSGDVADAVRLSALLQWLPLAGAGLGLVALSVRPPGDQRFVLPPAAVVGLAATILVTDLFRANMGFNPAIPVAHAEQPITPSIRYLQSRTPNRFAVLSRPGIDQPLQPDLSMRYGLYDARGYDYPVERRYDSFWRTAATTTGDFIEPTQRAGADPRALHALSLLSVTDFLQYPSGPLSRLPGLPLAYAGPDARVYRNPDALPRAFLVDRQRTVSGADAALAAVTDTRFDARRAAITERPIPALPQDTGGAPSAPGSARILHYGQERVIATVHARTRSVLILTDVHFPGWKATVDGRTSPIERVNYLFRGVVVPVGTHRVEFRYQPASWRVGWIVSVLGLLALAVAVLAGARRHRR